MKVYTFSTEGCRDGLYLANLSSTLEGVKELINDNMYLDSSQNIKAFDFIDDEIIITIWDNDLNKSFKNYYDLITFDVV